MDESVVELLSRHLDNDLDPDEAGALEDRLAREAHLRDELAAMALMRHTIQQLAARDTPPARLDTLIEPLRRGRSQPSAVRPAYRWLAAAASVVLAVVASVHVMRGSRETVITGTAAGRPAPGALAPQPTPFKLQPLPTVSEDEEVVSVADRILAEPIPEPLVAPPAALEVYGPLPQLPGPSTALGAGIDDAPRDTDAAALRASGTAQPPAHDDRSREESLTSLSKVEANEASGSSGRLLAARPRARLVLEAPGGIIELDLPAPAGWSAGQHRVRAVIRTGQVRQLEHAQSEGESAAKSAEDHAAGVVAMAVQAPGVPDGEYPALLVVGPEH